MVVVVGDGKDSARVCEVTSDSRGYLTAPWVSDPAICSSLSHTLAVIENNMPQSSEVGLASHNSLSMVIAEKGYRTASYPQIAYIPLHDVPERGQVLAEAPIPRAVRIPEGGWGWSAGKARSEHLFTLLRCAHGPGTIL